MKKLLLVLLVVSLLVLSACGGEKTVKEEKGETTASLVTDMAKAFMLNVPYKCEYTMEGITATTYMKGEKRIKTMTVTPQGSAESIIRDDMLYSWDPNSKKGIKMKLEKQDMPSQDMPKVSPEYIKEQAMNVKCSPAKFGDEMFEVPTDVEFQDMTELLKQMQEQLEQLGDMEMPEGY